MRKKIEDEKRPAHRPPEMEGGRRMNVYLDAATIETAKRLGGGNISEGLRIAVTNYKRDMNHADHKEM